MNNYYVINYDDEIRGTTNLIDAVNDVMELKKTGKKVYVITGNIVDGDLFIERVRRIYR